jgi:hypothetical protein
MKMHRKNYVLSVSAATGMEDEARAKGSSI